MRSNEILDRVRFYFQVMLSWCWLNAANGIETCPIADLTSKYHCEIQAGYSASEQATLVELAEMSDTDKITIHRRPSVSRDHGSAPRMDLQLFSVYITYWDIASSGCAGQTGNGIRCRAHCD